MQWIALILIALVFLFGFVIAFGAPYLPTMRRQTDEALDLLELKPGQHLLELGCGDGRVMLAAARRGYRVTGYELNPILVLVARLVTFRYRSKVKVIWGNFWTKKWPPADGIFTFLLQKYMPKLDKKIAQTYKGKHVKLVSFAFSVPGKKASKKHHGLYRYDY